MADDPHDPKAVASHQLSYPALASATAELLNQKLFEAVSLSYGRPLTDDQVHELVQALAVQSRNTEALHQFPLSNSDEPAFVLSLTRMSARDR